MTFDVFYNIMMYHAPRCAHTRHTMLKRFCPDDFNITCHNMYKEIMFMSLVHSGQAWRAQRRIMREGTDSLNFCEDIETMSYKKIVNVINGGEYSVLDESYDDIKHLLRLIKVCILSPKPNIENEVNEIIGLYDNQDANEYNKMKASWQYWQTSDLKAMRDLFDPNSRIYARYDAAWAINEILENRNQNDEIDGVENSLMRLIDAFVTNKYFDSNQIVNEINKIARIDDYIAFQIKYKLRNLYLEGIICADEFEWAMITFWKAFGKPNADTNDIWQSDLTAEDKINNAILHNKLDDIWQTDLTAEDKINNAISRNNLNGAIDLLGGYWDNLLTLSNGSNVARDILSNCGAYNHDTIKDICESVRLKPDFYLHINVINKGPYVVSREFVRDITNFCDSKEAKIKIQNELLASRIFSIEFESGVRSQLHDPFFCPIFNSDWIFKWHVRPIDKFLSTLGITKIDINAKTIFTPDIFIFIQHLLPDLCLRDSSLLAISRFLFILRPHIDNSTMRDLIFKFVLK